tara:strand:- start:624 stop:6146 length:5523 start_codon:yes stop_codon:yes gene_type:complete
MATKNLVPRASGEGSLGTSTKKWGNALFVSGSYEDLKVSKITLQDGTGLIQAAAGSTVTVTTGSNGEYLIDASGGSSAEADKIISGDTQVVAIDASSASGGKIEITLDNSKFWEFDSTGDFIPHGTNKPSVGSATNKVEKVFVNDELSIGDSVIKYDTTNNKLQLRNTSSDTLDNIVTSSDLTAQLGSYLTSETDTLDTVVSRGATTQAAITINNVVIGSSTKEIKLNKIISTSTNEDVIIEPNGTGVTRIGGNDSVDIKKGEISIKSDGSSVSSLKIWNTSNSNHTKLIGSNVTSDKSLVLPIPSGSSGTLALKSEVDAMASGIKTQKTVRVASTLPLTVTQNVANQTLTSSQNGAFSLDGISSFSVNDRILIKDQEEEKENGVYVLTTVGDSSSPWVLTRSDDFNNGDSVAGYFVFVEQGSSNADKGFVCINNSGSDNPDGTIGIEFSQFSKAGEVTAGTGLTKSGSSLNVDPIQTQITSVGTLSSLTTTGNIETTNGILTVKGFATLKDNLTVAGSTILKGDLVINDPSDTHSVTLKVPEISSSYSLTLPTTAGTDGYVLKTDGSGTLEWIQQSSGGIANVAADPNPTLGGWLKTGSNRIQGNLLPDSSFNSRTLGSDGNRWLSIHGTSFFVYDSVGLSYGIKRDSSKLVIENTRVNEDAVIELLPKSSTYNSKLRLLSGQENLLGSIEFDGITGISVPSPSQGYPASIVSSKNTGANEQDVSGLNFLLGDSSGTVIPGSLGTSGNGPRDSAVNLKLNVGKSSSTFFHALKIKNFPATGSYGGEINLYEAGHESSTKHVKIASPQALGSTYPLILPKDKYVVSSNKKQVLVVNNASGQMAFEDFSQSDIFDLPRETMPGDAGSSDDDKFNNNDDFMSFADKNSTDGSYTTKKATIAEFKNYFLNLKSDSDLLINTTYNPEGASSGHDGGSNRFKAIIQDNKVTKAKLEQVSSKRVLGNLTANTANVEEIEVDTDSTLGGESATDTKLVTQKAIRDYIESRVSTSSAVNKVYNIALTDSTPRVYWDESNNQAVNMSLIDTIENNVQGDVAKDKKFSIKRRTQASLDIICSDGDSSDGIVYYASSTAYTAAYNNSAGTLTNSGSQSQLDVDGQNPSVSTKVLIKNQTDQRQNGIYVVTNTGSNSTNWVLTRDASMSTSTDASGFGVFVKSNGSSNNNKYFVCTSTQGSATPGTDNIVFEHYTGSQTGTKGSPLPGQKIRLKDCIDNVCDFVITHSDTEVTSTKLNNGDTIYSSGSVTVSVDSNVTAFSLPIGWSNTFTQNNLLKEIRDAIFADPANEQLMNLTLELSDLPAQANGQQTLQVKQSIGGTEGNVAVSNNITNITLQGSTGGSSSQNTFDGGLNDGLDDLALDGFKYSHAEMLESDLNLTGTIDVNINSLAKQYLIPFNNAVVMSGSREEKIVNNFIPPFALNTTSASTSHVYPHLSLLFDAKYLIYKNFDTNEKIKTKKFTDVLHNIPSNQLYRKRYWSNAFSKYSIGLLGFSSNKLFEYPVYSIITHDQQNNKDYGNRSGNPDLKNNISTYIYHEGLRDIFKAGAGRSHYILHKRSETPRHLVFRSIGIVGSTFGTNDLLMYNRNKENQIHIKGTSVINNAVCTYEPFISRLDDRNIDNNLQGIPTIFLPKLDEGSLYNSNDLEDRIIKIKVDPTNISYDASDPSINSRGSDHHKVIFAFRTSKLNNRGPILSPENDSITRDYTVPVTDLSMLSGEVVIRPGQNQKHNRLPYINNAVNQSRYYINPNSQMLKTYLRDAGSSSTFHGVVMHADANKLATFFEWQDFILIEMSATQSSTFEFKIKKIQKTLTKDDGTQVTYNLFNWFLNKQE